MAQRAELERQLNDLAFLREQVAHLKSEAATARRFAAGRAGTFNDERKGAQRLLDMLSPLAKPPAPAPARSGELRVELRQDGTVAITPAGTR
jgi:hypothetical protein